MAEYIDRAVALSMREPPKSDRYYQTNNLDDAYGQGWDAALSCLEKLPAADVVEVVRCQNCKHSAKWKRGLWCTWHDDMYATEDYFCADGERKDNE